MNVTIRPMCQGDKPSVLSILHTTPEFAPADIEVAEELIDIYLEQSVKSGYHILVAEDGGEISGYICYGPTPLTEGTWDIYWVAVSRMKQKRGVGGALMKAAEENIRKANGRLIIIETSSLPSYEKTRRFYSSKGYNAACQIADFYADGDDKVIFQKKLR
jgi:predicted N-acetyltransferase YhbS